MNVLIQSLIKSTSRNLKIPESKLVNWILMSMLIFLIFFNQNITRGLKDSLLVSYVGAEIIGFVKMFVEIPLGLLFTLIYTKLYNHFTSHKIFIVTVILFILYFGCFGFLLFENRNCMELSNEYLESLASLYPRLKWMLVLCKNWVIVLFYVMSEMWPVIICLFFWQLASNITSTKEAFTSYPLFSLMGQTSLIVSGFLLNSIHLPVESLIKILISIVIFNGLLIICLYTLIVSIEVNKSKNLDAVLSLGIVDSFKLIIKSRYLIMIAVICMSYHICINLIESVWFFKVRQAYPNSEQFIMYHGYVLYLTGIFTLVLGTFSQKIISKYGWRLGAAMTPIMLLITGASFFISVLFKKIFSLESLTVIGGFQNIVGRGTKYALYDATKEMLYIDLDQELRIKGKAAVDVAGVKLGRFISVLIQIMFFTIWPNATYDTICVPIMIVYVLICIVWIKAVFKLSKINFV